jgi:hypothetical protein
MVDESTFLASKKPGCCIKKGDFMPLKRPIVEDHTTIILAK